MSKLLFKTIQPVDGQDFNRGVASYLAVSGNTNLDTLRPYLRMAQQSMLISVLGETQLNSLADAYDANPSTLTAAQLKLLLLAQAVVANLGYVDYLPIGNVHVGEGGITVSNNTTHAPASQWRVKDLRDSLQQAGYQALEDLVLLLWSAASDYASWNADAAAKLRYREHLVNHTEEFSKWWNVGSGYDLLQRLRPSLRKVENLHLKQSLGDAFYTELITAWRAKTSTSDQIALIEGYLQPALVNLAIADGLPKVSAELTARGLLEYRVAAAGDNVELRGPAGATLEGLQAHLARQDGLAWMNRAIIYLNANATMYPTWATGNLYVDPAVLIAEDDYTNRLDQTGGTFML